MILGDSIAVGIALFAPHECVSYAHGGWNSWQWNSGYRDETLVADTVVISLGTNDWSGIKTEQELKKLRARVHATRVVWVLPYSNRYPASGRRVEVTQAMITRVSFQFHDTTVNISRISRDHIHPSWQGYRQITSAAFPGYAVRQTPWR